MKKVESLTISLTKRQIYQIREYVTKNGYEENCGKEFWLIMQPVVREFRERLEVLLLTKTQGRKLEKVFKQIRRQ